MNPPPAGVTFHIPTETASDATDSNLTILSRTPTPSSRSGSSRRCSSGRTRAWPRRGGVVVTLQYPATGTPLFKVSHLVSEGMTAPVPLRTAKPRYPIRSRFGSRSSRRSTATARRTATWPDLGPAPRRHPDVQGQVDRRSLRAGQLEGTHRLQLVRNGARRQLHWRQANERRVPGGNFGAATLMIPPGATTPTVAAGFDGSGGCIVCHSASADGATLVSAMDAGYIAKKFTFPGTAPNGGVSLGSSAMVFGAINPTSTRMYSSAGAFSGDMNSRLFDINGAVVSSNNAPPSLKAGYPSFRPTARRSRSPTAAATPRRSPRSPPTPTVGRCR